MMLEESVVEKVMLCVFNTATVAEGFVSDIFQEQVKM